MRNYEILKITGRKIISTESIHSPSIDHAIYHALCYSDSNHDLIVKDYLGNIEIIMRDTREAVMDDIINILIDDVINILDESFEEPEDKGHIDKP